MTGMTLARGFFGFLGAQFVRLDAMLGEALAALHAGRVAEAESRLGHLRAELEWYFQVETQVLFPEYERLCASGDRRLTAALVREQDELRRRLAELQAGFGPGAASPLEAVGVLLDAYRAKKELFLYPTIERQADERALRGLLARVAELLQPADPWSIPEEGTSAFRRASHGADPRRGRLF
jgi:hypothetical protein